MCGGVETPCESQPPKWPNVACRGSRIVKWPVYKCQLLVIKPANMSFKNHVKSRMAVSTC